MTDRYIKFILTVIAGLLGILVLRGVLKVPEAQARQPLECTITNASPIPVSVSPAAAGGLLVRGTVRIIYDHTVDTDPIPVRPVFGSAVDVKVTNPTSISVCNRCR
jgi:hypothetical protein